MQAFHATIPPHKTWIFHRQFVADPKSRAITIAIIELDAAQPVVYVGISRCSLADNFCKKKGRDIATGRAEKSFYVGGYAATSEGGLHEAKRIADKITMDYLNGAPCS